MNIIFHYIPYFRDLLLNGKHGQSNSNLNAIQRQLVDVEWTFKELTSSNKLSRRLYSIKTHTPRRSYLDFIANHRRLRKVTRRSSPQS